MEHFLTTFDPRKQVFFSKTHFKLYLILIVFVSTLYQLHAQTCTCNEYIYLNEVGDGGKIHKYRVNANGTLTEINPTGPWFNNNSSPTGLGDPHGLGRDLNGYYYVAETSNGDVRKMDCDGKLFTESEFVISGKGGWNFASIGNTLYINRTSDGDIGAYSLCNGSLQNTATFCDQSSGGENDWGFYYDKRTGYFYSAYKGTGSTTNNMAAVLRYTTASFATGAACIPTWIAPGDGTLTVGVSETVPNTFVRGMTTDENGNLYIVERMADQFTARILKYDADGKFVKATAYDGIEGNGGWALAAGISYSETSKQLYVSTASDDDDCISRFDLDLNYLGAAVPAGGGDGNFTEAKAIAIAWECCPGAGTLPTINETFCGAAVGTEVFLNQFLPCENICAGKWSVVSLGGVGTFNDCNSTLTFQQNGTACFKYSYTPSGPNAICSAFEIDVCIRFVNAPTATLAQTPPTCSGGGNTGTAQNDGIITIQTSTDVTRFGISAANATKYNGPNYGAATVFTANGQQVTNSIPNTGGTYIVRLFNGSNKCYIEKTVTFAPVICTAPVCTRPVAKITPKIQTLCVGQSASAYTATVTGTSTGQQWYGPLTDTTSTLGTAISAATNLTYAPTAGQLPAAGQTRYFAIIVQNADATCADTAFAILTMNAKPVVGNDTICSPATTASVTRSPAGGTWVADAANPATATITAAGAVSGLTANGTYKFIYTLNGCSDTATVVRNAKPNAGADKSLACADPVAGTLQTTTTLTGFTPTGGTWAAQTGNPASATVTNAGAVSGMTIAGTYNFIYTSSGCVDTVAVTVQACSGCTKPNAGNDQSICAPMATATLTGFTPAGGTWAAQTGNPATATVTNAGAVSGMTASGTYKFIYSVVAGGQTCTDTVAIIRNAKPVVGNDTICSPATTASVTRSPAGGTWVADAANPATATITAAGAVSGLTANGTYKFIYTLNGCSDTATVVRNAKPNAGADKSLACADPVAGTLQTTTTLTGFTPTGGTWAAQTGNPASATVTNAGAVSGMTIAGTYNFIYTSSGCVDTVAVTVQACSGCTKPNAGNDQSICAPMATATLTGFSPAGGTWAAQTGNPAAATVTNAGAVSGMTASGTYKFIYSVVAGGQTCTDTVAIIRNAKPVVGNDTICSPATTASVTRSPAGGTWIADASNPATATITAAGAVSGLTANGTYKFIYTLNGCSDTATVVRNAKPNAGADKSLACADPVAGTLQTTTSLTGFTPTGGTWAAQSGNPATATVTNAGAVSGMTIAGTYNFIYTASGCVDTVAVTVQACSGCTKPNAGNDQSICAPMATATLTGFTPAGGTWAAQSGNPAAATVTNAGAVSGMTAAGTYKFIYSVVAGGQTCTDTVAIIRNAKPVVGNDTICSPATTASVTRSPAGGTWIADASNPATATITAAGAVSGLTANGTYKFIYTLNGCKDTATVVRNAKPNAGADKSLACADPVAGTLQTTTTLTGFTPAGGTWAAQTGNPASATVTNAGAVSGMTIAGTYNFIYTSSGCVDTVAVTVQACSGCTKPNAGNDQSICAPMATATLTGFTPAGGTWAAQTGNPATATVTNAGAVSGMTASGTYKFIYSVVAGGQTCTDTVAIIRNAKPVVGNDTICSPATTASVTRSPAGGTWIADASNPATATITAAGAVSGLTANGTYKFIYTLNGCSDTATVVRNAKPNAGADKSLACADPVAGTLQTTTTLTGFTPTGGTWAAQAGNPATATVTNAGAVSGMTIAGTYNFIYTSSGCVDTVAVTVQACSGCTKPNAGNDQSICAPMATATLTGFTPAGGTWAAQTGNPATATVTNAGAVSGMTASGTYKFIYSVVAGGQTCTDTVAIIRNAKPVVGNDTICSPATTASVTRSPAGGTWVADASNPATATITAAGAVSGLTANGTYKFIYTLNGCSDTATVVRNAKPNAGADKSLACADPVAGTLQTTTTLTGFTPAGGTWAAQAGNPASATVTNAGAVSGMTIAGTYNFIYTSSGCVDTVAVTVQACSGCTKPNAGSDVTLTCPPTGITPTTATLTPVTAGGTWAAQTGNPAAATVTNAGAVSGMTASGTYKFIYLVVAGGQTCTDTIQVIVPTCVQPKGSIGDYVWKDANNNGIQDETTPNGGGVAGVQIELYKNGTFFAKDTTDSTGKYLFTNLEAGTYKIKVLSASLPAGCEISSVKDAPNDDAKDSDVDKTTGESGNYEINPLDPTKKDILTVDAALVVPCVKSKVTLTGAPVCSADVQTYSITFSVTNKVGNLKVNKGTLTGGNPYTVTGIPSGATLKITDSLSAVCKFDTLITGPNCNCNPPLPLLITPSMTACAGDTFPTLKAMVVGLATVEWFTQPMGGTAVFTGLSYKPSGTVPTTGAVFYAQARSTDPTCPTAISTSRVMASINAQDCTKEVDLALKKSINTKIAQIGDVLTYTLKVWNESNTNATGVEVTDSIATTVQFVAGSFVASRAVVAPTIVGNVIKWNIGNIAAAGDTVTLTYRVKATQEGVHFNTAEISKTNEKDKDSTPGNGKDNEDDIDRQCFTVPVKLCPGEQIQASVPNSYTNVQWFKNGSSTPIATGNVVMLSDVGIYTYTATNQTCPASGCCPIIIEAGVNCCAVDLCIPFTVKKKRK